MKTMDCGKHSIYRFIEKVIINKAVSAAVLVNSSFAHYHFSRFYFLISLQKIFCSIFAKICRKHSKGYINRYGLQIVSHGETHFGIFRITG